jgi:hypothetical protein
MSLEPGLKQQVSPVWIRMLWPLRLGFVSSNAIRPARALSLFLSNSTMPGAVSTESFRTCGSSSAPPQAASRVAQDARAAPFGVSFLREGPVVGVVDPIVHERERLVENGGVEPGVRPGRPVAAVALDRRDHTRELLLRGCQAGAQINGVSGHRRSPDFVYQLNRL